MESLETLALQNSETINDLNNTKENCLMKEFIDIKGKCDELLEKIIELREIYSIKRQDVYEGEVILCFRIKDYNNRSKFYLSYIKIIMDHTDNENSEEISKYFKTNQKTKLLSLRKDLETFEKKIITQREELKKLQQELKNKTEEFQIFDEILNNYRKKLQIEDTNKECQLEQENIESVKILSIPDDLNNPKIDLTERFNIFENKWQSEKKNREEKWHLEQKKRKEKYQLVQKNEESIKLCISSTDLNNGEITRLIENIETIKKEFNECHEKIELLKETYVSDERFLHDGKIIMIYRIEDYNMRLKSYRSYIEINDNHMKYEKLYKYFNINGDVIFSKLRGNIEKFDENIKTCEKELNNLQQKIENDSKELQILDNSLNNYMKELQTLIMR